MNSKPDPQRQLQDCLDDLRDQILEDMPAQDQQKFIADLKHRIQSESAPKVTATSSPFGLRPVLLAAAVLVGIITMVIEPWNTSDPDWIDNPPPELLENLALIQPLSQLDPQIIATLSASYLGAATLVFEDEQDIPFDLLLAAVEEEE